MGQNFFLYLKKLTSGGMEETGGVKLRFVRSASFPQFQLFILLMESDTFYSSVTEN